MSRFTTSLLDRHLTAGSLFVTEPWELILCFFHSVALPCVMSWTD